MTSQRDRFRGKAEALDVELAAAVQARQRAEEAAHKAVSDRDELYNKVRFLEAYAAGTVRSQEAALFAFHSSRSHVSVRCVLRIRPQIGSGADKAAGAGGVDAARISCGPLLFAVEDEAQSGDGADGGAAGPGHARRRRARVTCFGGDQGAAARRKVVGQLPPEGAAEGRARRAFEARGASRFLAPSSWEISNSE